MTSARRAALMLIDWNSVRMFSLDGRTIQVVADSGPATFEFDSETEARLAYEEWMKRGSKAQRKLPN
jgi:hypothetical protein